MSTVPSPGSQSVSSAESPPSRPRAIARVLASFVTVVAVFAVGASGGWYAAKQTSPAGGGHGEDAHAGHDHGGHDHGGHDHGGGAPAPPKLDARTLGNLGVEVGEVALTEFVRLREVPAVVEPIPARRRAVRAPVAGTVARMLVESGQRVAAGAPVAELRRDPFPRPTLSLTEPILRPLNEEFHASVAALRTSTQALAIARTELERVRKVLDAGASGQPRLPVKVEIDLQNEERRALLALENAREETERHGLTPAEVAEIEGGGRGIGDFPPVQRVLQRNLLWSPDAQLVLDALPAEARRLPYTTAVVAELAGSHLLSPELAKAISSRPKLAASFLDVAGLLQGGLTLVGLVALEESGGLDPVVTLKAPSDVADGDVVGVAVNLGSRLDAGGTAVEIEDRSHVWLRMSPAGPDLAAVSSAISKREKVDAEPLVAGGGPKLAGLEILRIDAAEREATHAAAYCLVPNEVLVEVTTPGGATYRTWKLREGMRYIVWVPVERLPGRFVLPADAVTPRGPESLLLLEDGTGFKPVPVRVEHLDSRVAVIANDGAVFAGDRVVLRGAYALALAIQAASGGPVDPHAGHHH